MTSSPTIDFTVSVSNLNIGEIGFNSETIITNTLCGRSTETLPLRSVQEYLTS